MSGLFYDATFFNDDISKWDVSRANKCRRCGREKKRYTEAPKDDVPEVKEESIEPEKIEEQKVDVLEVKSQKKKLSQR